MMERSEGFKPPTPRVRIVCSILHELRARKGATLSVGIGGATLILTVSLLGTP